MGQHSALSLAIWLSEPAASPASDEDSESSKEEECAPIEPTVDLLKKLALFMSTQGRPLGQCSSAGHSMQNLMFWTLSRMGSKLLGMLMEPWMMSF
jgi:hypothetical protein